MTRTAAALASALAGLALVACSSTSTPPASDGGIDASTPEPVDSGPPPEPDAGCDVGTPPDPLPEIVGGFAVDSADGGSPIPVATGGDPVGLWVFDHATFYVGPAAATMFDVDASTVEGTAWLEVTATEFALDWRFITTLAGTIGGTIVRPSSTQIRASYTLDGAMFVPDPICAQSSASMAASDGGTPGTSTLSFSQSGDSIQVQSALRGAAGSITIVLDGTRRASR